MILLQCKKRFQSHRRGRTNQKIRWYLLVRASWRICEKIRCSKIYDSLTTNKLETNQCGYHYKYNEIPDLLAWLPNLISYRGFDLYRHDPIRPAMDLFCRRLHSSFWSPTYGRSCSRCHASSYSKGLFWKREYPFDPLNASGGIADHALNRVDSGTLNRASMCCTTPKSKLRL